MKVRRKPLITNDWARGGMVDAADLKSDENPIKSMPLSDCSVNVHGIISAGYREESDKNVPLCNQ